MPCTTRSTATTFWRMPMPSAAIIRVRRVSTVRILRTSRRMGSSDGWRNWRLLSGRRLIGQSQSDECLYRRPTAIYGRLPPQDDSAGIDGMGCTNLSGLLMEQFALLALMGSAASGLIRSSATQALSYIRIESCGPCRRTISIHLAFCRDPGRRAEACLHLSELHPPACASASPRLYVRFFW